MLSDNSTISGLPQGFVDVGNTILFGVVPVIFPVALGTVLVACFLISGAAAGPASVIAGSRTAVSPPCRRGASGSRGCTNDPARSTLGTARPGARTRGAFVVRGGTAPTTAGPTRNG